MKYVLDIGTSSAATAALKPRSDINKVLSQNGWQKFEIYDLGQRKIIRHFKMLLNLVKLRFGVRKSDIILVQWRILMLWPFSKLEFEKLIHGKRILFLHDIDSLRSGHRDFPEFERFCHYDVIIAHTGRMREWLISRGITVPVVTMEVFDYLTDHLYRQDAEKEGRYSVVFAGNLSKEKSGFLYQNFIPETYLLKLYGVGYSGESSRTVLYQGYFLPEEILSHLKGSFGLVWDGDGIDGCKGSYGEYLKYNCPHKISMYFAAGLPVIIWEGAAMAGYVKDNKVGICVRSLSEIENIFKSLTWEEYCSYVDNVIKIQKKIISGKYITAAVKKAEKILRMRSKNG